MVLIIPRGELDSRAMAKQGGGDKVKLSIFKLGQRYSIPIPRGIEQPYFVEGIHFGLSELGLEVSLSYVMPSNRCSQRKYRFWISEEGQHD